MAAPTMNSRKLKINQAVLIYMVAISVISIGCLGVLWISSAMSKFKNDEIKQRSAYMENQKAMIKSEVDRVLSFVNHMQSKTEQRLRERIRQRVYEAYAIARTIYEQEIGKKSLDEIKSTVIHTLYAIRYNDGRGSYFVFDLNGIDRLCEDQPELEGRRMMTVKGDAGERVVPDMLTIVEADGEGFYRYTSPKPGSHGFFPKIAFVKLFEPLGWVFGTVEYIDDVRSDIQQECLEWIARISFGKDGYIFAGRWDGLTLSGPATGKNMFGVEDVNGVKIVQELIQASRAGGGFVHYVMPPLEGMQQSPKISYAVGVPEWQWYIGAGVTMDDIEPEITMQRADLRREIRTTIRNIVLVLIALLVLIIVVVRFLSNRIGDNVRLFREFFSLSATEAIAIESHALYFREFEQLADAANEMVGQRKQAETALRESERKFRLTFDSSPDAINLNRVEDGLFVEINEGFTQLTGFTREDVIAKTSTQIKIWHEPEDRLRLVGELKEKGVCDNLEARFRRKDGSLGTGLMSARIISLRGVPHIISITRDISERKQAEEQLKASQERFREIAELLPETVYEMDLEGNLTFVNRSAFEHFRYSQQDFDSGLKAMDMIVPDDRLRASKNIKAIIESKSSVLSQYTALRKDGSTFPVLFKSAPIVHDGKPAGLRGIIIDVTDKQQLEERLRQAQKMEAIGTLAGGIAHDFNNILSPMIGYADLLRIEMDPQSPHQAYIEGIYQAATRAKELVSQILLFSRNAAQEVKPLKLQPIVKEALKLLQSSIPSTIEVKQDINPDCGPVIADPTQIHQIVMNLATNAYHAMEDSGGQLSVSLQQVELEVSNPADAEAAAGSFACLIIADTGVGMPPTILDKIFDPYFTTKKKGKGTGLGLSVVQGIVQSSGGMIRVHSEPGKGTEFKILLPVIIPQATPLTGKDAAPIRGGTERILLVDDEEAIVKMTRQMLERMGYRVVARVSGIEGLEAFRANPGGFDLIITDMTMPHITGDKLAREAIAVKADIPVIICTGFSEKMDWEKAKSMGIKGFLMKPVVMSELSTMVRTVLDAGTPSLQSSE